MKLPRLFRRRPRPLALHRLPWKNIGGVRLLALNINATTQSGGRYGMMDK